MNFDLTLVCNGRIRYFSMTFNVKYHSPFFILSEFVLFSIVKIKVHRPNRIVGFVSSESVMIFGQE